MKAALFIILLFVMSWAHAQHAVHISQVQHALHERGYNPGTIDGVLGNTTRSAMMQYQGDQRLGEVPLSVERIATHMGIDLKNIEAVVTATHSKPKPQSGKNETGIGMKKDLKRAWKDLKETFTW